MSLIDEARDVRERISARLRELEPLVAEYHQLRQLGADLGIEADASPVADAGSEPRPPAAATRPRGGRRPSPAKRTTRGPQRSGGRRASGGGTPSPSGEPTELAQRVLEAVRANPGRTVADYSEILGVPPTALYRPVRELSDDGSLVKRARQLFPPEAD